MAKEIKVTFKREEEDLYKYILLKGKGLYLKELVRKDMENIADSQIDISGSFDFQKDMKNILRKILEDTHDIKRKLAGDIINDNSDVPILDVNIVSKDCKIRKDFTIDDLD